MQLTDVQVKGCPRSLARFRTAIKHVVARGPMTMVVQLEDTRMRIPSLLARRTSRAIRGCGTCFFLTFLAVYLGPEPLGEYFPALCEFASFIPLLPFSLSLSLSFPFSFFILCSLFFFTCVIGDRILFPSTPALLTLRLLRICILYALYQIRSRCSSRFYLAT